MSSSWVLHGPAPPVVIAAALDAEAPQDAEVQRERRYPAHMRCQTGLLTRPHTSAPSAIGGGWGRRRPAPSPWGHLGPTSAPPARPGDLLRGHALLIQLCVDLHRPLLRRASPEHDDGRREHDDDGEGQVGYHVPAF